MILDKTTVGPNIKPKNLTPTIVMLKTGMVRFSMGALNLFGAKGDGLQVRFKFENGKFFVIPGPSKEAFVATITQKTSQCVFSQKALCTKVFSLLSIPEDVPKITLTILPAIELRHEGFCQHPLVKQQP